MGKKLYENTSHQFVIVTEVGSSHSWHWLAPKRSIFWMFEKEAYQCVDTCSWDSKPLNWCGKARWLVDAQICILHVNIDSTWPRDGKLPSVLHHLHTHKTKVKIIPNLWTPYITYEQLASILRVGIELLPTWLWNNDLGPWSIKHI